MPGLAPRCSHPGPRSLHPYRICHLLPIGRRGRRPFLSRCVSTRCLPRSDDPAGHPRLGAAPHPHPPTLGPLTARPTCCQVLSSWASGQCQPSPSPPCSVIRPLLRRGHTPLHRLWAGPQKHSVSQSVSQSTNIDSAPRPWSTGPQLVGQASPPGDWRPEGLGGLGCSKMRGVEYRITFLRARGAPDRRPPEGQAIPTNLRRQEDHGCWDWGRQSGSVRPRSLQEVGEVARAPSSISAILGAPSLALLPSTVLPGGPGYPSWERPARPLQGRHLSHTSGCSLLSFLTVGWGRC